MVSFTPLVEREDHGHPKQEMSQLSAGRLPSTFKFSDRQYLNILQSVGQSVHAIDPNDRIIYWNKSAENLFGYSAEEALGQVSIKLVVDIRDYGAAYNVVHRIKQGERWTGMFPVKKKSGERFTIIVTNNPFYDDAGCLIGGVCTCMDAQPFYEMTVPMSAEKQPQQELSFSSHGASKVTNNVKSRIRVREENMNMDPQGGSRDTHHSVFSDHRTSTPTGDIPPSTPFGVFEQRVRKSAGVPSKVSDGKCEGKPSVSRIVMSKAEAWIGEKGKSWLRKGNERNGSENRATGLLLPWFHNDQVNVSVPEKYGCDVKPEIQVIKSNLSAENDTSGYWTSALEIINKPTPTRTISFGITKSSGFKKVDVDTDCLSYDIIWEDLIIGEQIGQGSYGAVYRGLWNGSDVAIKVFSKLEYTDDMLHSFRQEVSLMKLLRHPNILLFMGAVTSPEHLCIVTEFLQRGSLFQLLHRNQSKLQWRQRVDMAIDIAAGMNYLHHCNPPIIHQDLKSSNLLVDENWAVKVGDFGLARPKHETFLVAKSGKGTPRWMAPELLRNEPSDEKSDVYSYGVILWELTTEKIPWDNLNTMQVIGVVGFMNQRLEIPNDVDQQWASIIESCWHSDPSCRPTFLELLERLRAL